MMSEFSTNPESACALFSPPRSFSITLSELFSAKPLRDHKLYVHIQTLMADVCIVSHVCMLINIASMININIASIVIINIAVIILLLIEMFQDEKNGADSSA